MSKEPAICVSLPKFARWSVDDVLQGAPPLVDVEITAWLTVPPVKRASSQTTYNCPVLASMATSGRLSPVRMAWPVFGSVSATVCSAETTVGCDQVLPPSDDEMN